LLDSLLQENNHHPSLHMDDLIFNKIML